MFFLCMQLTTMSPSLITFEIIWCLLAFGLMGSHVTNYVRYVI